MRRLSVGSFTDETRLWTISRPIAVWKGQGTDLRPTEPLYDDTMGGGVESTRIRQGGGQQWTRHGWVSETYSYFSSAAWMRWDRRRIRHVVVVDLSCSMVQCSH